MTDNIFVQHLFCYYCRSELKRGNTYLKQANNEIITAALAAEAVITDHSSTACSAAPVTTRRSVTLTPPQMVVVGSQCPLWLQLTGSATSKSKHMMGLIEQQ